MEVDGRISPRSDASMSHRLISQQMLLEHEILARLSDALRTAIGWSHHGGVSRKLESLQFLTESFQRHLERMLDLEEQGGYLELVGESHPAREAELNGFRAEHDRFRQEVQDVLQSIAGLGDSPGQDDLLPLLDQITSLVDQVDAHNKREMCFLQEIVLQSPSDDSVGAQ
jgi:hemerythrin-like domain-containing protein